MPTKRQVRRREKKQVQRNCWSLDLHLSQYAAKHVRELRNLIAGSSTSGVPPQFAREDGTLDTAGWLSVLDDMVYFLESYQDQIDGRPVDPEAYKRFQDEMESRPTLADWDKLEHEALGTIYEFNPKIEYPEYLLGREAIRDPRRYRRGMIHFLKFYSNLWI